MRVPEAQLRALTENCGSNCKGEKGGGAHRTELRTCSSVAAAPRAPRLSHRPAPASVTPPRPSLRDARAARSLRHSPGLVQVQPPEHEVRARASAWKLGHEAETERERSQPGFRCLSPPSPPPVAARILRSLLGLLRRAERSLVPSESSASPPRSFGAEATSFLFPASRAECRSSLRCSTVQELNYLLLSAGPPPQSKARARTRTRNVPQPLLFMTFISQVFVSRPE